MFIVLLVTCVLTSFAEADLCDYAQPNINVDWSKLNGSWYHHMIFGSGSATCRKMNITDVDIEGKLVSVRFEDLTSYSSPWKQIREEFAFFRWSNNPGIIYAGINQEDRAVKLRTKMLPKRKSLCWKLAGIRRFHYTILDTDHRNYIIFLGCNDRVTTVGVSLRSIEIEAQMVQAIQQSLTSTGVNFSKALQSSYLSCYALQKY